MAAEKTGSIGAKGSRKKRVASASTNGMTDTPGDTIYLFGEPRITEFKLCRAGNSGGRMGPNVRDGCRVWHIA